VEVSGGNTERRMLSNVTLKGKIEEKGYLMR
jgi:hypothetical protein